MAAITIGGSMADTTINDVADYFIRRAHESGEPITNLKLQKLVYYAQAWHLALYGEPLVEERFEAWVHGPVSPLLYDRFRAYRWNPIDEDVAMPTLPERVRMHLEEVQEAYGGFSAIDLERMTHVEDPWLDARGDLDPTAPSHAPISEEAMQRYYASRAVSEA